jgi:uncharacterized Fe-S cluster protein YjdI
MSNKPAPFNTYEFCKGESPQATHICQHRENCKRFLPAGYKINYKDFWIAIDCPKFESK